MLRIRSTPLMLEVAREDRPPPETTPGLPGNTPLADPVAEAARVLDAAHAGGLTLRLIGGVAIAFLTSGTRLLPRDYQDVDFITSGRGGRQVQALLTDLGYDASTAFNGLHGHRRLLYFDPVNDRKVDVFVGEFAMCHSWAIRDRLRVTEKTLPPADLLLTKLQIRALTEKDQRDTLSLLYHCEMAERDESTVVNGAYVANLCARDWGLWRTCTLNIEGILGCTRDYDLRPEQRSLVTTRLTDLQERIERAPKSTAWKMRARIGERIKWYEEPEEVG
jgi:hypothetical protein